MEHAVLNVVVWDWFRVGLDLPTIEVRYEHLSVDAEAYVGGRALPTVFNFIANILEVIESDILMFSYLFFNNFLLDFV